MSLIIHTIMSTHRALPEGAALLVTLHTDLDMPDNLVITASEGFIVTGIAVHAGPAGFRAALVARAGSIAEHFADEDNAELVVEPCLATEPEIHIDTRHVRKFQMAVIPADRVGPTLRARLDAGV